MGVLGMNDGRLCILPLLLCGCPTPPPHHGWDGVGWQRHCCKTYAAIWVARDLPAPVRFSIKLKEGFGHLDEAASYVFRRREDKKRIAFACTKRHQKYRVFFVVIRPYIFFSQIEVANVEGVA